MKQLVSLLALVVFLVGCNTVSPEAAAYKSIGVIATTVDASMLGWGDYVKAGLAKPNEEAKVKEVYQKYQASMLVAKVGVLTYLDNKEQKDSLQTALTITSAVASQLVTTINQFMTNK